MKAKFLKRTVSAVLAGVMAVPATGFSIIPAFATTETSTNSDKGTKAEYVVDFGNVKNGKITFTDDKTAAAKSFKAGTTVKVKMTPDDGYEVKSFKISDASSGKTLAEKETKDDVFSFAMPSQNITLAGEFSKKSTGASDNTSDSTGSSKKAENDAKKSVNKDASDTTEYIKNGLSDSAVSKAEKTAAKEVGNKPSSDIKISSEASNGLTPVKHQLTVDYLLADSNKVSKNSTIDSVWKNKKNVLTQVESDAQLYSVKGNENVYVAFTDAGRMNGIGKATYADFTDGDSKNPKSYNGEVTYDKSTGIVYVPRSLFVKDGKEKQSKLVAQLLVPYDLDNSSDLNGIRVTIENHDDKVKEVAKSQTVTGRSLDVTTTIPVATKETAKDLDLSKVNIYINDSEVPAQFTKNEYFYNTKTGKLTFKGMPASIYSVRIVINGTATGEKIAKAISTKTFAGNTTESSPSDIKSADDLLALQDVGFSSDSNITADSVGSVMTFNTTAYYNYSVNYLMKNHKNVYSDVLDYYYYCYYCNSSSSVSGSDWNTILTSLGLQRMTENHAKDQAFNEVYAYAFKLPKEAGAIKSSDGKATLNFGGNADWPMTYLPLARANANQAAGVLNPDTYKNGKSVSVSARILSVYQKSTDYKYVIIGFTMNDGTGTQPAQGIYKLRLTTSASPGYVSVQASSDMNDQVHVANGYYSLKNAKYGVYELDPDTYKSEKEVAVITTDENGYGVNSDASAKHMKAGNTYYIKELGTHPSPGHEADIKVYPVVAVSAAGSANVDAARAESKEPYLKDPLGELLKKIDKADANADLSGAEFKLSYYGSKNVSKDAVGSANAEKTWTFKTDKNGVINYSASYKASGDDLWTHNELHLGTYTLQETKAPVKYTTKGTVELTNGHTYNLKNPLYFRIQENGNSGVEDVDEQEDAFAKQIDTNGHSVFIKVYEVRKRGKFTVNKLDKDSNSGEAQGDAESMKWSGKVYAAQDNTWVDKNNNAEVDSREVFKKDEEVYSFETDDNGHYTPDNYIFGYGSYYIKETSHPTGYKTSNQVLHFSITEDEQTVEALDSSSKKLTDEIFRGAFSFTKFDADSNTAEPQGDATLKGAQFSVINSSKHYVYVSDERYETGATVLTFTTDDNAQYASADKLLPYGTYTIKETAAPTGYLNSTVRNGVMETSFSIRNDEERVNVTGIKDPVIRGKISLEKNNADVHNDDKANTASGDASFEGAEFTITNKSANAVYVDANQDGKYSADEKFAPDAVIQTITTDKDGKASTPDSYLPYGTYEVKETKAPEGYLIDNDFRGSVTVKSNQSVRSENQTIDLTWSASDPNHTFYDAIERGQLKIKKNNADVHSDSDAVKAQGDSSLKGAEYTIYNKSKSYIWVDTNENGKFDSGERYEPGAAVKVLTTDENGYAQTPEKYLPYGSYTIKETKAPEGYLLDNVRGAVVSMDFTITSEGQIVTKHWSSSNTEDTLYDAPIRGGFKFEKKDAETKKNTPLGGATLAGTFAVVNKSKSYVWVDVNGDGTYSSDEKFKPGAQIFTFTTDAHDGTYETKSNTLLPYGTYQITETKAPTGYLKLPSKDVTFTIRSKKETADLTNDKAIYNYVKRGDLYFQKKTATGSKDAGKASKMPYIPFKITSLDQDGKEIESHIVYTDANGIYDSRTSYVKHTYKTNEGDKAYAESKDGKTPFLGHVGTWFGVGSTASDNLRLNTTGAFPYGKYKIEELECAANKGYDLYSDTFVINHEEATDITMDNDPEDAEGGLHGNPDFGPIYNYRISINPEVTVKSTGEHTSPVSDDVELNNKVEYSNLNVDEKYTIKAHVYDAETNTPIKDKDGNAVVVTKSFTASSDNGSKNVDIDLDADALGLSGKTIVIYDEVVKDSTGKVVASHEDPTDTDMQVRFPDVSTKGVSKNTGIGIEKAKKDVTLVDTVSYKAFEKGKKYTLKTRLYDKTADKYIALSGAESAKETKFTADDTAGSVKVEATIDASDLENHSLVFYEEVYKGSTLYAKHEDKNADEQTVRFPKITLTKQEDASTDASDSANGKGVLAKIADFLGISNTNAADDEEKDAPLIAYAGKNAEYSKSVKCENLVAGQTYTLTVNLIDSETKEQVKDADGNAVSQTVTFTASSETETKKVKFAFDATGMGGKTLNTDASLQINNYEIAEYVGSEKTALHIPSVKTEAAGENGTKYVKAEEKATIKDTVSYGNVIAGYDYTVKGSLVDAETGKEVSTAEAKFTAKDASGTADVTFTADTSSLKGKSLVVYEDIYYGDTLVGEHKDAKDADQTVTVVDISSNAYDSATKTKQISLTDKAKVTDEVTYAGLVKGEKYTLTGTVSDKETGKEVATASKEFTAKDSSGAVTLEYEFDATANAGKVLSVSESLKDIVSNDGGSLYVGTVTGSKAAVNGEKTAEPSADTVITDSIAYDKLLKGSTYKAEAVLYDNETGKPLTDKNGKEISGTAEFTADDESGTVNVSIKADTSSLAGKKLFVFEKIYMGDIVVAYHNGTSSDDSTVTIAAKNSDTGDQTNTDTGDQTNTDTGDQTGNSTSDGKSALDAIISLVKGFAENATNSKGNNTANSSNTKNAGNTDNTAGSSNKDAAGQNGSKNADNGNGSAAAGDGSYSNGSAGNGAGSSGSTSGNPSSVTESGKSAKSTNTGDYNHIAVYAVAAVAAAAAIAIVIVLRKRKD